MVLELMAVEVESLSGRRLVGCFSVGFPRAGTTWTTSSVGVHRGQPYAVKSLVEEGDVRGEVW